MRIRHLPDKGLKSVVLKMITKFGRMKEGTTKTSAKRKHEKEQISTKEYSNEMKRIL